LLSGGAIVIFHKTQYKIFSILSVKLSLIFLHYIDLITAAYQLI